MVHDECTTEPVTSTDTAGLRLRPYEFIATPPIALVLDAIAEHCGLGGSITPGVRELARWAGVSAGQITPLLRQLAYDGWILYDGRIITLIRHPDQASDQLDAESDLLSDQSSDLDADRSDQLCDRPDLSKDRSDQARDRFSARSDGNRTKMRQTASNESDLASDRFGGRMVHDLIQQQQSRRLDSAAAKLRHVPCAPQNDQAADRLGPAALLLAELGANPKIIAEALDARPDLTPAQVQATWRHFQARIAAGRVSPDAGAFFDAIRAGQIHAAPPDPDRPIDPAAYAGSDLFRAGGDTSDLEDPPAEESPHERARRLAPDDLAGRDFVWFVALLAGGATDDEALEALEARRKR